ncbi:hypothetical protein EK21DRAFT_92585 [Setomelanomma holmii]|uniref:RNase H type-1 domain-containing protein n=1 Tax=Setomelanomma holmii TaxID=210430 RepID=A0A9P4LH06_9PLEO|nr:hypothetical protein EK21DRAFT_92585 [Setomelanomma holmii]
MARIRSTEEEAARVAKREARREANQIKRAARKAFESTDPASIQARLKARQFRDDVNLRLNAIREQILGRHPLFEGDLLISESGIARLSDLDMLASMGGGALGGVHDGSTLVYWTDGNVLNLDPSKAGSMVYLGAGVVSLKQISPSGKLKYKSQEYIAGRNTGSIGDAELYAITSAIGLAIQVAKKADSQTQRVRILTDRCGILQGIPTGHSPLGPFTSPRLALQDLYEGAAWLTAQGIKLELAWVKGHDKSKGNKLADKAARRASQTQAKLSLAQASDAGEEPGIKVEAPAMFVEKGAAWKDEWLWRANKNFLVRSGKAIDGVGG